MRLLAALTAVLLVAGCGSLADPLPVTSPDTPSVTATATATVAEPTAVRIPVLGVSSTLSRTGMDTKTLALEVPPVTEPMQASWFSGGGRPGVAGYPAIVLGHVSGRPAGATRSIPGVFAKLSDLKVGQMVHIDRADSTTATFVVTKVNEYRKASFPAGTVYADTDRPEMRLITCGGEFDPAAHSYKSNIVVYAELVD